jgi:hypothetical protein
LKKYVVPVTALVVALAVAAVAFAQTQVNTYEISGGVSPKGAAKKKNKAISLDFGYKVSEQAGLRPSPVKKYSIRVEGGRVNGGKFPKCTASQINNAGTDARCPKGSAVGSGFIENATGATDNKNDRSVECNGSVTVYNSGQGKGALWIKGDPNSTNPRTKCAIPLATAIPAKYVKRGNAIALEFNVPSNLLHPAPGLDNAVVSVTSKIKRLTRRSKGKTYGYYEALRCKGGKTTLSVVFTPEVGTPKTASRKINC